MRVWHATFGNAPMPLRKAREKSAENPNLLDAMLELLIDDFRGELSPTKLGLLLGNKTNRIVRGYQLQLVKADGWTGWSVVKL